MIILIYTIDEDYNVLSYEFAIRQLSRYGLTYLRGMIL